MTHTNTIEEKDTNCTKDRMRQGYDNEGKNRVACDCGDCVFNDIQNNKDIFAI